MKTQPYTGHRLEQIIHYRMKNWVPVIRKKTPYRIENWVCNALIQFGFTFWIWAGTIPQKNILGDYFTEGGLDYHFIGTDPRGAVPQHGQAQKHSYNDVYILQYIYIYK